MWALKRDGACGSSQCQGQRKEPEKLSEPNHLGELGREKEGHSTRGGRWLRSRPPFPSSGPHVRTQVQSDSHSKVEGRVQPSRTWDGLLPCFPLQKAISMCSIKAKMSRLKGKMKNQRSQQWDSGHWKESRPRKISVLRPKRKSLEPGGRGIRSQWPYLLGQSEICFSFEELRNQSAAGTKTVSRERTIQTVLCKGKWYGCGPTLSMTHTHNVILNTAVVGRAAVSQRARAVAGFNCCRKFPGTGWLATLLRFTALKGGSTMSCVNGLSSRNTIFSCALMWQRAEWATVPLLIDTCPSYKSSTLVSNCPVTFQSFRSLSHHDAVRVSTQN